MEKKCPVCNKLLLVENESNSYESYYEHIAYCW